MGSFTWGSPFGTPFYEGGGTTLLAPYVTDVALGGHAYMIDWSAELPLKHASIPILRQQQDTSDSPGEQSINPEGLWRRVGESWHLGAGQERYDRDSSSPFRFHRSQGVNVWEPWNLSLLKDTVLLEAMAETNLFQAVAGSFLYLTHGTHIGYNNNLVTPHIEVTGGPANNVTGIASNGFRVWTAHGVGGVYMTTRGAATTASHITGTVDKIDYVKNRVMVSSGPSLYDVTALAVGAGGALPAALFTHGNTDWNWVGFAESQGFIFAVGYSGDKSLIYSLGITTDGTALASPTVAGSLPDGEIITAVYGYLGRFLTLGTNKGFRLALVSDDGGLTIGALIATPSPVLCFEGQEEFIWFGMGNIDAITTATASGLGRMSTAGFADIDRFVPAYTTDLMVEGETDNVVSVVTFEDRRVFTISGQGRYTEHLINLVPTGALETGQISYGLTEPKTALFVDLQVTSDHADASILEVMLSADGGAFGSLGQHTFLDLETFAVAEKIGNEFNLRLIFNREAVTLEHAPTLQSWLLRVQPRPLVTNLIFATVFLAPQTVTLTDTPLDYDTLGELDYIERINTTKEIVSFQHNDRRYSVVVEDYEMNLHHLVESEDGQSGFNASCLLKLKRV